MREIQIALFLQHIPFLKPIEKLRMYHTKHTLQTMATWEKYDWELQIGRAIRSSKATSSFFSQSILKRVNFDLWWANSGRGWLCCISDTDYPELLRHIPDPPLLLYGKGNKTALSNTCISIVGTRSPDAFGTWASQQLAHHCVEKGMTIVSGLAYGIDVASHKAALEKHGSCIAVLGTSIDYVYPKAHKSIAIDILNNKGAIISEIAPRKQTAKYRFIGRNRIISGMSMNTIIVQAPHSSGALATADFALEQNRTVLVHRAGIQDAFMGSVRLWQDGATVCSWEDEFSLVNVEDYSC